MTSISEFLESLLGESKEFAKDELKKLIKESKEDNRIFIRHIGELTEEFIKLRALNRINDDEFKDLMKDVLNLNKIQYHKLSVQAKTRAKRIVNGLDRPDFKQAISLNIIFSPNRKRITT